MAATEGSRPFFEPLVLRGFVVGFTVIQGREAVGGGGIGGDYTEG